jgi:hypothetical protein
MRIKKNKIVQQTNSVDDKIIRELISVRVTQDLFENKKIIINILWKKNIKRRKNYAMKEFSFQDIIITVQFCAIVFWSLSRSLDFFRGLIIN